MPLALQSFCFTLRWHLKALGVAYFADRLRAIFHTLSTDSADAGRMLADDATEAFLALGETAAELAASAK